jgi:hypothetical protein
MNYAAVRAEGLWIESDNTEATCKTLVQVRMKRALVTTERDGRPSRAPAPRSRDGRKR